jgi:hypothetical protein
MRLTRRVLLPSDARLATRRPFAAIALLLVLASASCADDTDAIVIDECFAALDVTVPLATIPAKLRIVLTPGVGSKMAAFDECAETTSGGLWASRREPGELVVEDIGFGTTPPRWFDLTVTDLGTCDGEATVVWDARRVEVMSGVEHCGKARVTLPAAAPR